MDYIDPIDLVVPAGCRGLGEPPYWKPGQTVVWTYRRFDFAHDRIEVRRPMRVIDDGPEGSVLWLPGGREVTETRFLGWEGRNAHDVPLDIRFRPPAEAPRRVTVPARWQGLGVLKIAPPRMPFSVWVLVKADDTVAPRAGADDSAEEGAEESGAEPSTACESVRTEWYINLESIHRRTAEAVYTSDHILDITFPVAEEPLHLSDGTLNPRGAVFKDVHEIAAAAQFGYWPKEWSDIVRTNGSLLLDRLELHRWALDPGWEAVARELARPKRTIRPGAREHRRVPAGCYIRPDSR